MSYVIITEKKNQSCYSNSWEVLSAFWEVLWISGRFSELPEKFLEHYWKLPKHSASSPNFMNCSRTSLKIVCAFLLFHKLFGNVPELPGRFLVHPRKFPEFAMKFIELSRKLAALLVDLASNKVLQQSRRISKHLVLRTFREVLVFWDKKIDYFE